MTQSFKELEQELEKLDKSIEYENAMYENALAYPTETEQFYIALGAARQKIAEMYNTRDNLRSRLANITKGERDE